MLEPIRGLTLGLAPVEVSTTLHFLCNL